MNTERIKSLVLLLLVTTSFVLTTRIWFNISISGLFVMPPKPTMQAVNGYDKDDLLKPDKLIVHTGQQYTMLLNYPKDKEDYHSVLNGSKAILRDWLNNYESYTQSSLPKEQLQDLRIGRAVELIFERPMELANIKGILDIEKEPWSDIKEIDAILIAPDDKKLYIIDKSKSRIHQYAFSQMSSALSGVISEMEKRIDSSYLFLNAYTDSYKTYGDYAIASVSITSVPTLEIKSELDLEDKQSQIISTFFNNDESANIISGKNLEGNTTFTDREEETLTIDEQGALKYYKYNVKADEVKSTSVAEAIETATQYVNLHLGFTYDFYLSTVESKVQGGRTSYIIGFDYKYNGVPVIRELNTSESAIEVEILGHEVIRYKRNVRAIEDTGQTTTIKSAIDILNLVWGKLDQHINNTEAQSIVILNDIYLAYYESNDALTPVWVIDVDAEDAEKNLYNKKYVIGAEEGVILEEK